jgi:DNA gyrase subunit B
LEDVKVSKIIIMSDADLDGGHIAALIIRLFVMYFPFIIEAGILYKSVAPLYSIPDGKSKKKFFIDQVDIIKYNQKVFMNKYELKNSAKKPLTPKDVTKLLLLNNDYIYYLEKSANTYALDPYLLQLILYHYLTNKNSFKFDKLKKEVTSKYRFMDVYNEKKTILVKGTIDKFNLAILNDRFLNDCKDIIDILNNNDELYYFMNGSKSTLYDITKAYNSTIPNGLQRYKGLGEMQKEDLYESIVNVNNRVLIQYSMQSAKETFKEIREFESNPKKILAEIKSISRDDLVE